VTGLPSSPSVPVSWGELLDKITILEIKRERSGGPAKWANVDKECRLLRGIAGSAMEQEGVAPLLTKLKSVNEALWEIEEAIRAKEAEGDFGADFVRLARSVYKKNDERAALKRRLNLQLNSDLVEEKSYRENGLLFPHRRPGNRNTTDENKMPAPGNAEK